MTDTAPDPVPPPRENPSFIGQDAAEATLLSAILGGRMPHAWLLSGPHGIGKATLAYRAARFLLAGGAASDSGPDLLGQSSAPETLFVPQDSPTFRQIAAGGHANLRVLESAPDAKREEITVNEVRGLNRLFRTTAWESGWRIAIVDPADALNRSAMNAILKMLEEPPEKSVFFLVSHAPGRLLPTIRSRCRQLIMRPLEVGALQSVVGELRPDLDNETLAAVAPLAEGSPGKAFSLIDGGGLELYEALSALLNQLPELDIGALHDFAQMGAKRDEDGDRFALTEMLLSRLLASAIRSAAGSPPESHYSPDCVDALAARIEGPAALDRWAQLWENTRHLLGSADRANLDREQVLLETFFELQAAARG